MPPKPAVNQKGKQPTKPTSRQMIRPPTKKQIKGEQVTVVQTNDLNKLLGRGEFAGDRPVDLTSVNEYSQNIIKNQSMQNQVREQQTQQGYPSQQQYQQPQPFYLNNQQAQQNVPLKPSEMSASQYSEYERKEQINGWKTLIDIVVNRNSATQQQRQEYEFLFNDPKNLDFRQMAQKAIDDKRFNELKVNGANNMIPGKSSSYQPSVPTGSAYQQKAGHGNMGQPSKQEIQEYNQNAAMQQQIQHLDVIPPYQKKPSEMTKQEYEQFEKQRQFSSWKRLIEIVLIRKNASQYEQNEFNANMSDPEFKKLVEEITSGVDPKSIQPKLEPLRPQPKATDAGQFKPTYETSGFDDYQRGQYSPQRQDISANNKIDNSKIEQQLAQIAQLQQQQLQIQQQSMMNIPAVLPQIQTTNQHVLQQINDLQLELQVTQQQASKYQMDVTRLERENSALKSELLQEQEQRRKADFKCQQLTRDLDDLRFQIQQLQTQFQANQNQMAFPQRQVQVQSSTPVQVPHQPAQPAVFVESQSPFPVSRGYQEPPSYLFSNNQNQQQPAQNVQKPPEAQGDPNFASIALNDIDQVMKNANIILNKYQDFDQSYKSPSGQQVQQMYRNLLHKSQLPTVGQGNDEDEEDLEKLLRPQESDKDIDVTKPPDEVPASLLNGVPEYDGQDSQATSGQSGQPAIEPLGATEDLVVENIGSLLPKSKYNSRANALRK